MKSRKIRPLALCVFHFQNKILVSKGYDHVKKQYFYRPLGGKIQFFEPSIKTIEREILEELNLKVKNIRYLGTLENMFVFNGKRGHEIAMIYDGEFIQKEVYNKENLVRYDDKEPNSYAQWLPLNIYEMDPEVSEYEWIPLYPTGLLNLLGTLT